MPKLEPKIIQRELEQGVLWPVYWLYGQEPMKARELLKRIKKSVLGDSPEASGFGFGEEVLDGSQTEATAVVESAKSLSLAGGLRFLVIRDAHLIKTPEVLAELLGPKKPKAELEYVCVFLSKDLDGRKKFSKTLIEKAAVVPCEEVVEPEREAWVNYLAKRRGLSLDSKLQLRLASLEIWSLDIVDQELEKYSLAGNDASVFLQGAEAGAGTDAFLDAFFRRDQRLALGLVGEFADRPEEALPLLGLLSWNIRQLALWLANSGKGANPYLADKLRRWASHWQLGELSHLQSQIAELDFGFKQTPKLPLGLWTDLVITWTEAEPQAPSSWQGGSAC